MKIDDKPRCGWSNDEVMLRYHDEEWGVPVHDDCKWFEFMLLDAFQAGLSWKTVLHKREAFRRVFRGFDPVKVARMSDKAIENACQNPAIIRNRLKIRAAVKNARAFLDVQKKRGSFDSFIWSFTDGEVVSKALKEEGFSFVGSTICYAVLQAAGVVNDHLVHCFRYKELMKLG
jgi:DNA-3-methyladenine glycosylase I